MPAETSSTCVRDCLKVNALFVELFSSLVTLAFGFVRSTPVLLNREVGVPSAPELGLKSPVEMLSNRFVLLALDAGTVAAKVH